MLKAALLGVAATVALLLSVVLGPAQASAEPVCQVRNEDGQCTVWAPAEQATEPPAPPAGGSPGTATARVCTTGYGAVVDCMTSLGTWSDSRQCYMKMADPQPPFDAVVWAGHTDGVVYSCTLVDNSVATGMSIQVWLPEALPGPAPRELAQQALAQMDFRAGQLGLSPSSDALQIVGLQTWLWIADPDEHTVGPMTATATAGAVTVTATAKLTEVAWDMGDGTGGVVCDGPGTPYDPSVGAKESPTCGYTYTRSSARQDDLSYTVTATSRWVVHWAGGGESGDIPLEFTRSAQVQVGEIQALATSTR